LDDDGLEGLSLLTGLSPLSALSDPPPFQIRDFSDLLVVLVFYPLGHLFGLLVLASLSAFGYVTTYRTNRRVGLLIWLGGMILVAICFGELERESAGSIDDLGGAIGLFALLIIALFWSVSCGLGILKRSGSASP